MSFERKLISTLLRQKWIGPFYHTRNTHHIGGCLLAKVSRRRDTWRNIAVAVGSTGCGRRRPPSLCTTGGRRDARFSRTTLFLLATVVVSSYKRLPFCHQHTKFTYLGRSITQLAFHVFIFLK